MRDSDNPIAEQCSRIHELDSICLWMSHQHRENSSSIVKNSSCHLFLGHSFQSRRDFQHLPCARRSSVRDKSRHSGWVLRMWHAPQMGRLGAVFDELAALIPGVCGHVSRCGYGCYTQQCNALLGFHCRQMRLHVLKTGV